MKSLLNTKMAASVFCLAIMLLITAVGMHIARDMSDDPLIVTALTFVFDIVIVSAAIGLLPKGTGRKST